MKTTFVGVDLHKHSSTITALRAPGEKPRAKRFSHTQPELIVKYLQTLQPFELTVEATANYEWFARLVQPLAARFVLAHPGKLRIIAESTRKTDALDSRALADMLARDQIPEAYRPTPRQRDHRRLVRERLSAQRQITAVKNRLRHILSDYNLDRPDLFTARGQRWLPGIAISDVDRLVITRLVDRWQFLDQQLHTTEKHLREFALSAPPEEQRDRDVLDSIPGVGFITIETFLAEAANPRRFRSAKELAAYAGLVPGIRQSEGKTIRLGIEKTGSRHLRWVLVQAAWQLCRRSPRWHEIFHRLAQRIGKRKAVVALARRLLGVMFALLRTRKPYREEPFPDDATASSNDSPAAGPSTTSPTQDDTSSSSTPRRRRTHVAP